MLGVLHADLNCPLESSAVEFVDLNERFFQAIAASQGEMKKLLALSLPVIFLFFHQSACSEGLLPEDRNTLALAAKFLGQDKQNSDHREQIDAGKALSAKLAQEGNGNAIPFLIGLRNRELLTTFSIYFAGEMTPAVEDLILANRNDVEFGNLVIDLVRKNQSERLFKTFLSDLKAPRPALLPLSWSGRDEWGYRRMLTATALLKCEVPGLEETLMQFLNDPQLGMEISSFLAGRKYQPLKPIVYAQFASASISDPRLFKYAAFAANYESQELHDLVATKFVELAEHEGAPFFNQLFNLFRPLLERGVPDIKLSPLIRDQRNFAKLSNARREDINVTIRMRDSFEIAQALREKRKTDYTVASFNFWIDQNNLEQIDKFVAQGIDLNGQDDQKRTPLVVAATYRWPIAKKLIALGAKPGLMDGRGIVPLQALADQKLYGSIAMKNQQIDLAKSLIAAGADSSGDPRGISSPLLTAVRANNFEMARVLLESGADTKPKMKGGLTALHIVASESFQGGGVEMASLLLDMGADINAELGNSPNLEDGLTPLQIAIDNKDEKMEALLRSRGAKVSQLLLARRAAAQAIGKQLEKIFISH